MTPTPDIPDVHRWHIAQQSFQRARPHRRKHRHVAMPGFSFMRESRGRRPAFALKTQVQVESLQSWKCTTAAAAVLTKESQWVYYPSENTQWVQSLTHTHTHNAVSLWCANSHAYYITGLLLPGLTSLTTPCTLCCTWAINTLHPRRGWSKIPLQSIIHWETHQKREGRTGSAAQE